MNINADIAGALEKVFNKAQEISEKQSNESIKEKFKGWKKQMEDIELITDIQETNKSIANLLNEISPVVDKWEMGRF